MRQKRLVAVTSVAAGVVATPVEYVYFAVNTVLLVHKVHYYMHVFGVKQESGKSLKDLHHSLLKCRALLEPHFNMIRVITKLTNSEQSYKGKVKPHKYINKQNQSTTGKL